MKKNYIKIVQLCIVILSASVFGQNSSNIIINGTAGTGALGDEFATPVKTERGSDMIVTFTLTHGSNNIERAFMVVKEGSPAGSGNIGAAYNNIFAEPGQTSPYTEVDAAYNIPIDAALGNHTLRLNGKNYTGPGASGWGTLKEVTIEVVEAGSLSSKNINAFDFGIYPNPVNDDLTISTDETIESVQVLDLVGKTVISSSAVNGSVNVSSLKSGIYVVKVNSSKGSATSKFVKN